MKERFLEKSVVLHRKMGVKNLTLKVSLFFTKNLDKQEDACYNYLKIRVMHLF